jgi:uroporphyrinogen decarboxylase
LAEFSKPKLNWSIFIMTHRERVLTALAHKEPDRVPLDLGGSAYSINDAHYFRLKEYLGIQGDIEPYRYGHTGNYYDERVLEALDIDCRHVGLRSPSNFQVQINPDGTFKDEWGIPMIRTGVYMSVVGHPLAGATIDDIDSYPWPDPYAPGRTSGLREKARHYREHTDYALVSRAPISVGLFEMGCFLRGTDVFLMDLVADKALAHHLLGKISEVLLGLMDVYMDAVGDLVDIVTWGEDLAHQRGLFFSLDTYREMFKPYHTRIFTHVKRKAPNAWLMFHCCGSSRPLIPELAEAGADIIQSVQPLAADMDSFQLKRDFGHLVSFQGGIDLQEAMVGSLEDVEEEVKTRIRALAPGGGYILTTSNNVQEDVPPENLVHLFRCAKEWGRYPIHI